MAGWVNLNILSINIYITYIFKWENFSTFGGPRPPKGHHNKVYYY